MTAFVGSFWYLSGYSNSLCTRGRQTVRYSRECVCNRYCRVRLALSESTNDFCILSAKWITSRSARYRHIERANICQDQPKKMARDANALRAALGILKGIALLCEKEIYYRGNPCYRASRIEHESCHRQRPCLQRSQRIRLRERFFLDSP